MEMMHQEAGPHIKHPHGIMNTSGAGNFMHTGHLIASIVARSVVSEKKKKKKKKHIAQIRT